MRKRNWKDRFWELVFILFMTWLIFAVASCCTTSRPEYFNRKLGNIIKMEQGIGAIGLYNSQRLNSTLFEQSENISFQIGKPLDGSTKAWMDWYVMNEKLGKNGR